MSRFPLIDKNSCVMVETDEDDLLTEDSFKMSGVSRLIVNRALSRWAPHVRVMRVTDVLDAHYRFPNTVRAMYEKGIVPPGNVEDIITGF